MKIHMNHVILRTRRTTERLDFANLVTFLHGPISKGKSTVVRLIDYCLGGDLERTPALQQEFLSVELGLVLGEYECTIERAATDTQSVRVSWSGPRDAIGSVDAPINAPSSTAGNNLVDAEVYNLSDLIFHLCDVEPIRVRKRSRDPDSPLVRLSIRDIWWYCYLEQTHLDSSFFRLEDPFRGRKSQDAMRFFTGLYSERLSQIEGNLTRTIDEQRAKREAVQQIRSFIDRFELGSELGMAGQIRSIEEELVSAKSVRENLERDRAALTHPSDSLRESLRRLSLEIGDLRQAIVESEELLAEQRALKAELITAKTRNMRASQAGRVLEGVKFQRCPECGTDVADRPIREDTCRLCENRLDGSDESHSVEAEAFRRDLNERIDQIGDSIDRRRSVLKRMGRQLASAEERKVVSDEQLQNELSRYDSAYVESIRGAEREIATLTERVRSLKRLQLMPQAINDLEAEAGALQGQIDRLRTSSAEEKERLRGADENIALIAAEFKRIMLQVGFPGVSEDDEIVLDPRNWRAKIVHGDQEWGFWDTGSGGKKTLFNVCYALAIHSVALRRELPVPSVLIVDSPTKNISDDENPELVRSLYDEIYRIAQSGSGSRLQFILIDSDLVPPDTEFAGFAERRMAGTADEPSLIPYYDGP